MTRVISNIIVFAALSMLGYGSSAFAGETSSLKGKVLDVDGRPVEGAEVFVYDSVNTRRPADFISPKSDKNGHIAIVLPKGKYWVVARVRRDEKYGPLMPGDKHSGEPVEIEITDSDIDNNFVVADLRDVGKKKRAIRDECLTLKGRIIDSKGVPVKDAYVLAHKNKEVELLPDYLSAWTDEDGTYTLYLSPGEKYFVGAVTTFPPKSKLLISTELIPEAGKLDIVKDVELTVQ